MTYMCAMFSQMLALPMVFTARYASSNLPCVTLKEKSSSAFFVSGSTLSIPMKSFIIFE